MSEQTSNPWDSASQTTPQPATTDSSAAASSSDPWGGVLPRRIAVPVQVLLMPGAMPPAPARMPPPVQAMMRPPRRPVAATG